MNTQSSGKKKKIPSRAHIVTLHMLIIRRTGVKYLVNSRYAPRNFLNDNSDASEQMFSTKWLMRKHHSYQ